MGHPAVAEPVRSRLTPGEQCLLGDFVELTLAALGQAAVARILVFGSRARGAGHADSDLDVAVIAAGPLPAGTHRRLADLAEEAQVGREGLPHLRPILIAAGERPAPALLRAMTEEGIELWATTNA
jgi:predicted nucleotidyltransferase